MKTILILISLCVIIVCFFIIFDHLFYRSFRIRAESIRSEAGKQSGGIITENDLKDLPETIARYLRWSGVVGKQRISYLHLTHSGTFRTGADKPFLPIKGEYYLTSGSPSFCWYGKVSMFPGLTVSAIDSYFKGKGHMQVKLMSVFKIVDDSSEELNHSAFGRCVAEMTMIPTFFLDKERIQWSYSDSIKVECTVMDEGLKTHAELYFSADGALDRIVAERFYDRGNGQSTLEKFTGTAQGYNIYNGLKLAAIFDGYWNLPEGDLHYVHFIVDSVQYE